jgi:prepilin-type N-terminal cleavage/methylation domain-containing protein
MAQKYTILKVLIRNSNKGFTLLELIVGLVIMSIVGGMAMSAFVNTSASFQKDKKNIDSNQNLSAVLDIIGTDIRQAGEGINDSNFPVIEFNVDTASNANTALNVTNPQKSSRITIRKSIQPKALTLCPSPPLTTPEATPLPENVTPLPTQLYIATSASTNSNCGFTYTAPPSPAPAILPTTAATPAAWLTAINAREYRCQLDNLNSNYLTTTTDLCNAAPPSPNPEQLRAAVSDGSGHVRFFNYSDDNFLTFSQNYYITVNTMSDDARSKVAYPIGSPIYLIEEKVYALNNDGNLTLSINGGSPQILIKKIAQFNISARLYTNALDQVVNPTPTVPATTAASGSTAATTTIAATAFVCPNQPDASSTPPVSATNPQYVCQFNYNTLATDVAMNWKTIAGVKVSLQAKYDGTGQSATPEPIPGDLTGLAKLRAEAEYFPRNVLSK